MPARLTDQAAVAVALARAVAQPGQPTVAHLLIGLATEPEGRAGRRLRERATAAAALLQHGDATPCASLDDVLAAAAAAAGPRAANTVDLLDAAITVGAAEVGDLLDAAGYQRDLDGWLAGDLMDQWFEDAETYGLQPQGDEQLDAAAARVVAQVRAVNGGAIEVLVAAAAAPDAGVAVGDPADLAAASVRLRGAGSSWNRGLDVVTEAARTLRHDGPVRVLDLIRAALVAGGDGPRLVLEFARTGVDQP